MTFSSATPVVLRNISHGYGDRLLFDSVDLTISPGEHVVVIGENGAGKSTLLRLIAGVEPADSGTLRKATEFGYLSQQQQWPEAATIQDALDAALVSIRSVDIELEALRRLLPGADQELVDRYDELMAWFALRDGYQADSVMDTALDRLGLSAFDRSRPVASLSGGEAARLALACLLADPAPVLLLDEPTNHLDAAGLEWLESRLMAHRGTVVVVSHDRVLLRKFAQTVLEVDADQAGVHRYGNGYDGYLTAKRAERARWAQDYQRWVEAIARERQKASAVEGRIAYGRVKDKNKMAYGRQGGLVEAAVGTQIRNAQERLRRLEASPIDPPPVALKLSARLGEPDQGKSDHSGL